MVRKIASHVHKHVSRLLRANLITEPIWYQSVLDYPPLPLPPKAPSQRLRTKDKPHSLGTSRINRPPAVRPLQIHYLKDDIRRQFFRDHPFEAFRPRTLIEAEGIEDEALPKGLEWTRLSQRTINPSTEDAFDFIENLHTRHKIPLSDAYRTGVAQFRALRSEWQMASQTAVMEAESMGAEFLPGAIEQGLEKEKRCLATFDRKAEIDQGAIAARKRWRAIVDKKSGRPEWTKGQEYVRLWKEGVRPDYADAVTSPVDEMRHGRFSSQTS